MMPAEPNNNANEKQKIANSVDEPLEPAAKRRIHELDSGKHPIDLIKQARHKEKTCAKHIQPIEPEHEGKARKECNQEAPDTHGIRSYSGMREPSHHGTTKIPVE